MIWIIEEAYFSKSPLSPDKQNGQKIDTSGESKEGFISQILDGVETAGGRKTEWGNYYYGTDFYHIRIYGVGEAYDDLYDLWEKERVSYWRFEVKDANNNDSRETWYLEVVHGEWDTCERDTCILKVSPYKIKKIVHT